jgi:uncharacterized protein
MSELMTKDRPPVGKIAAEKLEQLRQLLVSYESCLVAYSGGVDSVFLALVAHQVLGDRALSVIADSPSLPRRELADAIAIGKKFGFPVRVVRTAEFDNPAYLANPTNRCYFCKHELFTELDVVARNEKFAVIAYGENASDLSDFRPGAKAAGEFQVRAPLKEAGLTKAEIREVSSWMGLPTADKPQMACLSSRIPHGEPVNQQKLSLVESAENVLRDLGFYDVRVRHHEYGTAVNGATTPATPAVPAGLVRLARIEVGPAELSRLMEPAISTKVQQALKQIGYAHVTVDLQGYARK